MIIAAWIYFGMMPIVAFGIAVLYHAVKDDVAKENDYLIPEERLEFDTHRALSIIIFWPLFLVVMLLAFVYFGFNAAAEYVAKNLKKKSQDREF